MDHWNLVSGSRAEGLTMKVGWGHENPDIDHMCIWKHVFGVPVAQNCQEFRQDTSEYGGIILLETGESPPGYGRLGVNGYHLKLTEYMKCNPRYIANFHDVTPFCFVKKHGRWWVSPRKVVEYLTRGTDAHPSSKTDGPAVVMKDRISEKVPTLASPHSLSFLNDILARSRCVDWPLADTLSQITQSPTLVVASGHRFSRDRDIEWRISCSHYELLLANAMPLWVKQAYWAFKYIKESMDRKYVDGRADQSGRII